MKQISVEEARQMLEGAEPPLLLDCRERWEHELCHLPGDYLIPLGDIEERVGELAPGRAVIVYCHHGVRSVSGAVLLERAGREAMSMRGGIDQWSVRIDPMMPRY